MCQELTSLTILYKGNALLDAADVEVRTAEVSILRRSGGLPRHGPRAVVSGTGTLIVAGLMLTANLHHPKHMNKTFSFCLQANK